MEVGSGTLTGFTFPPGGRVSDMGGSTINTGDGTGVDTCASSVIFDT